MHYVYVMSTRYIYSYFRPPEPRKTTLLAVKRLCVAPPARSGSLQPGRSGSHTEDLRSASRIFEADRPETSEAPWRGRRVACGRGPGEVPAGGAGHHLAYAGEEAGGPVLVQRQSAELHLGQEKAVCLAFYALLELVKRLPMARLCLFHCFSLASEAFRCSQRWRT